MSFIKCACGGRLVRDPEVRYSDNGMAVCKFSLVIDRPKKQGQQKADVDFFSFTAFGKLGELIGNSFAKGNYLLVTDCRPQNNTYTDKAGNSKTTQTFIVNSIDFTEKRNAQGNSFGEPVKSGAFDPDEIMF